MQRYKRGNWSVACVVSGRSSWQAKGNNATGAKVKAFPMGVAFIFCCPKLLGQLCSGEAQEGALSTSRCQGFSLKNSKLCTNSGRRCDVGYLLATRHKPNLPRIQTSCHQVIHGVKCVKSKTFPLVHQRKSGIT